MKNVSIAHQQVIGACFRARELEESGQYESAIAELESLWDGLGKIPHTSGLSDLEAGELLLRAGSLSSRLGTSRQISGSEDISKDLLTRAVEHFERIGERDKVAEAKATLATCYWFNGWMNEAQTVLREGLQASSSLRSESIFRLMITLALVEGQSGQVREAIEIFRECAQLCDESSSQYLIGTYHMNYALALGSAGMIDRALIEAAAASFYLEQIGHIRYQARVLNNVAMLLIRSKRLDEAHENLDRAERLFDQLGDPSSIAQVGDTRARAYLVGGKYQQAEATARIAVSALFKGDEKSVLVEALVTHATALMRLKRTAESIERFGQACEIAGQFISDRAATDVSTKLVEELAGPAFLGSGVNFHEAVKRVEARMIKEALEQCDNRITEASFQLGLKHQTLSLMLKTRHKLILGEKPPRRPRSLIKKKVGRVIRMRRVSAPNNEPG